MMSYIAIGSQGSYSQGNTGKCQVICVVIFRRAFAPDSLSFAYCSINTISLLNTIYDVCVIGLLF